MVRAQQDELRVGQPVALADPPRQDLWTVLPTVVPIGTQGAPPLGLHGGHPGLSLPALASGFPTWLADAGPADAVLSHGGTNDISTRPSQPTR